MLDQIYRKAILTVAERPQVEKLARERMWPLAERFVAGETIETALKAVKQLEADGIAGNLDLLGEFIDSPAKCTEFADNVIKLIDAAHEAGITPYVSLKLSSVGQAKEEGGEDKSHRHDQLRPCRHRPGHRALHTFVLEVRQCVTKSEQRRGLRGSPP